MKRGGPHCVGYHYCDERYTGDPWISLAVRIVEQAIIDYKLLRRAGVIKSDDTVCQHWPHRPDGRRVQVASYAGALAAVHSLVAWMHRTNDPPPFCLAAMLTAMGVDVPVEEVLERLRMETNGKRPSVRKAGRTGANGYADKG